MKRVPSISFKKYLKLKLADAKFRKAYDAEARRMRMELALEKKLRELRSKMGLTQKQLAEILETKQSDISRMEREGYSTNLTLEKLIRYVSACDGVLKIEIHPTRQRKLKQSA